jgi:hypothetical protein
MTTNSTRISLGFLMGRTGDQRGKWLKAYSEGITYAERRDLLHDFGLGMLRSRAIARAMDDSGEEMTHYETDIKHANACDPRFDPVALLGVVAWGPKAVQWSERLSEYEQALAQAFWLLTRPDREMSQYEESGAKARYQHLPFEYRDKISTSASRWARKLGRERIAQWLVGELNNGPLAPADDMLLLKAWYASGVTGKIWETTKEGK